MFKKLFFVFAILFSLSSKASHIQGGNITYKALGNNLYQFKLMLYRSTNGASAQANETILSNSPAGAIQLSLDSTYIIDANSCSAYSNTIDCHIYKSSPILLTGNPGAVGWYFKYEECCRNLSQLSGTSYLTFEARMFQNNNRGSAQFLAEQGFYFASNDSNQYNLHAYSPQADSIAYELVPAIGTNGVPVGYNPGYSYDLPLPDTSENSANYLEVNLANGFVKFFSTTNGGYTVSHVAKSYYKGQLVSSVQKDAIVHIYQQQPNTGTCSGAPNSPTNISFTVGAQDSAFFAQDLPGYKHVQFYSQAKVSDTLQFTLLAIDTDLRPDCTPQTIQILPQGEGLISSNSTCANTNGCATYSSTSGLTSLLSANVMLKIPVTCQSATEGTKEYYFDVFTNSCPLTSLVRVRVTFKTQTEISTPEIDTTLSHLDPSGNVQLYWNKPDTLNNFDAYLIWHQFDQDPIYVLDTLQNFADTFYTHSNVPIGSHKYWVHAVGGCGYSADTVAIENDSTSVLVLKNSIGQEEYFAGVKLFPQPATNELKLTGFATQDAVSATLFDLSGKMLKQFETTPSVRQLQLDVSAIKTGIYMLVLQQNRHKKIYKISIVK